MDLKNLEEYLKTDLSEEEKGALYVSMALAYLKTANSIGNRYLDMLEDAARALEAIDAKIKAK